ncbi:MAG: hypothetical protein QG588_483 [Candidatus Poribacteria bacterium]|nr:hypothetical protein [Candidatus Poribacteria bacterium]
MANFITSRFTILYNMLLANAAFTESAVNQVISKCMVKKQQMRWTQKGAHLLLQVRVQVLNDDWRSTFCRWYPSMTKTENSYKQVA